jgi:hypothetical protein
MRPHHRAAVAAFVIPVLALIGPNAAVAGAEPADGSPLTPTITQVPERPAGPGLTTFVANPAIVDSRPQGIESWSRQPDDHTLAVHFTTGTPECFGVDAEVQQTADIIAVKLRSGTLPQAVDKPCILIAVLGTVTVQLDSPVGDRAVVSIT